MAASYWHRGRHRTVQRFLIVAFFALLPWLIAGCGNRNASDSSSTQTDSPTAASAEASVDEATAAPTPRPTPTPAGPPESRIIPPPDREEMLARVPLLAERAKRADAALVSDPPVMPLLDSELDDGQRQAQSIALTNADFVKFTRDLTNNQPLRNEIMAVYPARPSDITAATAVCAEHACYRVEMFNYALNLTSIATVDLDTGAVLQADHLQSVQPELNPELTELALQIALTAPEVADELGFAPDEATMANTKTALNNTACESSQHLCVAPTIIVDDRALWAIVDLTDERLVGVRWTNLGDFSQGRPTEQLIQVEEIFNEYCAQENELARDGWELHYILTASDGLRVADVTFNGKPVLDSAKIVDWHVSYSKSEGFGYSDAVGCPQFSSSAVVATTPPQVEDLSATGESGFMLTQDYVHPVWPAPCNYRYQQRFEFYADGRFRVVGMNLGRGCGDDGIYRPILRIDFAAQGAGQSFAEWTGNDWSVWAVEDWREQTAETAYTPEGYQYRITLTDDGQGYYLEPGQGQWDDERGDHAYVYVTRHRAAEGDSELLTLGSCCNQDYQQGPDQFIDEPPENIENEDLVIWYVPQIENDNTPGAEYCWADLVIEDGLFVPQIWPCSAGPMFVPIEN